MTIKMVALVLGAGCVALAQDTPNIVVEQGFGIKTKTMGQAGMAGASTVQFVAGELAGGSPVKGAPYSAQAVTGTTQTLADGNRIVRNSSSMIYRDGAGRERRELSLPSIGSSNTGGEPAQTILISDPVAGTNYALDTKNRIATKMPAPPPLPQGVQKAPAGDVMFEKFGVAGGMIPAVVGAPQVMIYKTGGQVSGSDQPAPKVEQLGTMLIEGVQAEGTRTTMTIPAGQIGNDQAIQIVSERWYSPELKVTILTKHSDPRMGDTTYSLKNVDRSEPPQALFVVPSDYTVKEAPTFQYRIKDKQEDQ